MDPLFSDADRDRVASAVQAAEQKTSGEIVPYVVPRSSTYDAVPWRGGVLGALAAVALVALARTVAPEMLPWFTADGAALLVALAAGWGGAVLAGSFPPLTRALVGTDRMAKAVHRRAKEAFVDEEVFATRDRTGILLFISLLERRIEVLADAGIYQHVEDDGWADVTARIRAGIEADQLAEGLVDAIEQCGRLLEKHGIARSPDDADELSSHLRVRDE